MIFQNNKNELILDEFKFNGKNFVLITVIWGVPGCLSRGYALAR